MRLIHTADWHLCDRLGRTTAPPTFSGGSSGWPGCARNTPPTSCWSPATCSPSRPPRRHDRSSRSPAQAFKPLLRRGGTVLADHRQPRPRRPHRPGPRRHDRGRPGCRRRRPLPGGRMYLYNPAPSPPSTRRPVTGCSSSACRTRSPSATTWRDALPRAGEEEPACSHARWRVDSTASTKPDSTRRCPRCWSPTCTSAGRNCTPLHGSPMRTTC